MAANVTLSAAIRNNLLALQDTQTLIDRTNGRLNTGLRVAAVTDDAVAFFAARSLNERGDDLTGKKTDIDQAVSSVKAALEATDGVDSLLRQLKGIVTSAKSASSTERATLQSQYTEIKNQIDQLAQDASYQGLNLVSNSTAKLGVSFSDRSNARLDVTAVRLTTYAFDTSLATSANLAVFVSGANGSAVSTVRASNASGIELLTASAIHISASNFGSYAGSTDSWSAAKIAVGTGSVADLFNQVLDQFISQIDSSISAVRAAAKSLGANVALLQTRLDFTTNYVNVHQEGAGKYTLADLNEEGANLVSLQTKQQLGIQALSFSGQSEQSVLSLFR
jgi:flagellin-like hook-associated protein FlgL